MPDYSCYITIKNNLDCSLTYINAGANSGYWEKWPPSSIQAGATSEKFQLKDKWGAYGSDGWVRYRVDLADAVNDDKKPIIRVHFADPTGNVDNEFGASASPENGSSLDCHLFTFSHTDYPKRDHPLTVTLTIDYNKKLTTTSDINSITVPNPDVLVRNTKDVVNFKKNLEVWHAGDLGQYEDNSDTSVVGSYYPVAVDVTNTSLGARALDVYLNVVDQMLGVPFILYGGNDIAENVASSDPSQALMFSKPGTNRIRVTMSPDWASDDKPWGVVGNITWRLRVLSTDQLIVINSTRVEFYAITKKLPAFYKNVVDVTLLRRFVIPLHDETSWVDHCCQRTFTRFGFLYDSYNGGAGYARSNVGGGFSLKPYLADIGKKTMVNCYDQAAIMQICLGLCPTTKDAGYVFMGKFGWIVTTNLIGRGKCNNPFYLNSRFDNKIVCDNDSAKRSPFANHAFVSLKPSTKDQIVDACCGYHNGSLTLASYVDESIQTEKQTSLYRTYSRTPGNVSDADFNVPGVTNLDGTAAMARISMPAVETTTLPEIPQFSEDIERMIQLATTPRFSADERRSNATIADFFDGPVSQLGWTTVRSSVVAEEDGTNAEWVLSPGSTESNDEIAVKLFISTRGLAGATYAFGTYLGTFSRVLDSVFQRPSQEDLRGQLSLESSNIGNENQQDASMIQIWVYGNTFVRITRRSDAPGPNPLQLRELANKLQECIENGAKPLDATDIIAPKIQEVKGPKGPVTVGETFAVHVSLEGKSHATVDCVNGNAVLMEHNPDEGYFKFFAANPGHESISFYFAHQKTLNSTSDFCTIEIE